MARIIIRIDFDGDRYLGHGRIELLELIDQHGSIAKAAKAMAMSYKRAWYLAESINDTFAEPVIHRTHGGKGGGSATLSPFGRDLVATYRDMEAKSLKLFAKHMARLETSLAPPAKT